MNKMTLVLAHYYTTPQVQELADFVGDSLDLSLKAKNTKADRIVFAGVRFMAETAKIINPEAEVILPNAESTCSLVTQVENSVPSLYTRINKIKLSAVPTKVVTYINSSIKLKAISDIIVTSANVEGIISDIIKLGTKVFFTPDRNMGAYLKHNNPNWGDMFDYWDDAVCEVHDKFKTESLNYQLRQWSDGPKFVIAHPESPLPILHKADFVGSTRAMLSWIKSLTVPNATIYVATEIGLLHNMRVARPDLIIKQAPTYSGCQCNSCPYMKLNTAIAVADAITYQGGEIIKLDDDLMNKARRPIENMLDYKYVDA